MGIDSTFNQNDKERKISIYKNTIKSNASKIENSNKTIETYSDILMITKKNIQKENCKVICDENKIRRLKDHIKRYNKIINDAKISIKILSLEIDSLEKKIQCLSENKYSGFLNTHASSIMDACYEVQPKSVKKHSVIGGLLEYFTAKNKSSDLDSKPTNTNLSDSHH